MELNNNTPEMKNQLDMKDTRSEKYVDANDRSTEMTDEEPIIKKLEAKGFTEQFRVENKRLMALGSKKAIVRKMCMQ